MRAAGGNPSGPGRFGRIRSGVCIALAAISLQFGASGCATPKRGPPVPAELTARAVPAVPEGRYMILRDSTAITAEARSSLRKEQAWLAANGRQGPMPPMDMLAISGGGDEGAFTAGLLNGWTAQGTRPEFKLVTGISTGALIAPLAFLGTKYDPVLRALYTEVSDKDIFHKRSFISGFFGDAMADTKPLKQKVAQIIDRPMLEAIAAEYAKGRILMVGTTDLDTLEPVLWNMTAIAASKDPRAPDLFRSILVASAAIPAAFPPVMIDVTVDGAHYQEMHVDGGAMAQVFVYPPFLEVKKEAAAMGVTERKRTLYVIRNARLDPDWAGVQRRTLPIAGRAVSGLMQMQGIGDLYRIYTTTQRDGLVYNLAYIPATFRVTKAKMFDTAYMRALYQVGYDMAVKGYPWQKTPPGFTGALGEVVK